MAARLFHGSRPGKQKEKEEESVGKGMKTPKRASIISPALGASKIPTHVSMFSRNKAKQGEESTQSSQNTAATRPRYAERSLQGTEGMPSAALGPHKGAVSDRGDFGFATHSETSISTSSMRSSPAPRNRLRRKASYGDQRVRYAHSDPSTATDDPMPPPPRIETASSPSGNADPFPGSILGISLPAVSQSTSQIPTTKSAPTAYATSSSRMANYVSKQPPYKLATQDLPPPTPIYAARSSSASTRYSGSPGPFSRTSTPTSASSQSPGITQPSRLIPRLKTPSSPTRSRPPVTRRKIIGVTSKEESAEDQGLPPLRESSSSSSTVKAPEHIEKIDPVQVGARTRFNPPAPTPPLRLSSKRLPKPRPTVRGPPADERAKSNPPRKPAESKIQPNSSESMIPTFGTNRSRIPPPRPSREGTPRLESERPSPIIQSNLSRLETTGHKRRESTEKALLTSPVKLDEQSAKSSLQRSPSNVSTLSKKQQTLPSPAPARAKSPNLHIRDKSRTREPAPSHTDIRHHPHRELSPMSESPAKSPSRFGLFTRRVKSPADASSATSDKPIKKGPAAGTGHEGYGKYARRGRSGSVTTNASRGRSTSTDRTSLSYRPSSSRKSSFGSDDQPELDDFYRERLEPVVIGGGGAIRENRNSRSDLYRTSSGESNASLNSISMFGPPIPTRSQYRPDNTPIGASSYISAPRLSTELMPPPRFGLPSRSTTPEGSTLAHRRSLHRSQLFREAEPLKIPAPINTQAPVSSAALDSFDTMPSSIPYTDSSLNLTDDLSEGHEGNWLRPRKVQQRVKLPKKWNFFQRTQQSPRRLVPPESPQQPELSAELPAAISKLPLSRSVPHYAMMDNSEPEGTDTLEDLLHDIEDDLELRSTSNEPASSKSKKNAPLREREHSMLLPSPPRFPTEFTAIQRTPLPTMALEQQLPLVEPMMPQSNPGPRKRLQQVGRIPRVVSKRDRPHKPPPQSFSRPFLRTTGNVTSPTTLESTEYSEPLADQPIRYVQTEPLPSGPWTDYAFKEPQRPTPTNAMLFNLDGEKEFMSFSPRQNSDVSGSSSSGVLSFAGMTALLPRPDSLLKEDEVWDEYDELLDHVTSPPSTEGSWPGREDIVDSFPTAEVFPRSSREGTKKESPVLISPQSSASTTTVNSPPKISIKKARRHRPDTQELQSPQRSDMNPSTPMLLSEFYAGYGNRSSAGLVARQSISSGSRYSSQSAVSRSVSHTSNDGEQVKRYTKVMAEKIKGSQGTPDSLRYSALMTARWLSFDRVLFSPVQEEIRNNRQDKVLVLDGLGNDDWSSYCALTYPDATVYNLGTPRPLSGAKRDVSNWQPPPNHRQIHHVGIAHPFPFPKGFFTAVVLRFPVATSESALRNAVSESKRVLRPGGYLELCVLDMDMVNMGNRARRAVRGLKVRMQVADPEVSLSPTSDNIQKMLGRRGFENLNRCVVGVPVAGTLSELGTESPDERHTSLGEMLRDPAAGSNVPVTKMIAKVGRWWWSRCYERGVVADENTEESIWADKSLLKECETRDAGFRLVICYAQKPLNVRRRTVSV